MTFIWYDVIVAERIVAQFFLRLIDKNRAIGYDMVSTFAWGDKQAYNLCINTVNVEIIKIVPLIAEYAREFFKGRAK